MSKKMIITSVIIVALIALVALFKIVGPTGSAVYGKCWESKQLDSATISDLKSGGCTVEQNVCESEPYFCIRSDTTTRICCPFKECPDLEEVYCP